VEILKGKLLKMIIDDHESEGIVRVLQDAMVECLVFEREKMYQKIFSSQNGVGTDAGVTSKMRKRIEELTAENKQLAVANDRLTAKNKALDQYVAQCIAMLKKQKEIMGARGEIPRPELRQFTEEPQPMESRSRYEEHQYEEPRQPMESQSRYEETRRHRAEPQQHQQQQPHQQQYREEPRHSEPVKYNAPARWDAPTVQQPLFEQHLPREQQEYNDRHQDWEEPAEESPVEDQPADDGFLNIE
jgi:regulator of replication initiation timing